MSVIVSQLESTSASYSANHAAMSAMVDEFRAVEECARKKALSKEEQFRKRKKLLPLERLDLLLDRGAPFLELMSLAGYRMHDDKDGSGAGGGRSTVSPVSRSMAPAMPPSTYAWSSHL